MVRFGLTTSLLAISLYLPALAPAQPLHLISAAPVSLGLPYAGQAAPRVFVRGGDGRWRPAQARLEQGRVLLQLDPAAVGTPDIMLLIDPPAGLVMDDAQGPAVSGVEVDRKACSAGLLTDLGNVSQAPQTLTLTFTDAANALAPESLQLTVDDAVRPARELRVTQGQPREATVRLRLRNLEYGKHEVAISAADASPQTNRTTWRLRFNYLETGNLALASLGTKVAVDSCFAGYESLVPLNDGATYMPGDHCGNDISWASAETGADHWAELTFPKPVTVKEVSVYWAAYSDAAHTPRHFEVQVPEGDGWRAVYRSPEEGEKTAPLTTARFEPVTVSKLRVFMPKGEGPVSRSNLLWIGEIKAR